MDFALLANSIRSVVHGAHDLAIDVTLLQIEGVPIMPNLLALNERLQTIAQSVQAMQAEITEEIEAQRASDETRPITETPPASVVSKGAADTSEASGGTRTSKDK